MKFKYGDKVKIDSEFYGKCNGVILDYQLKIIDEYLVEFKDTVRTAYKLREWLKEKELTRIKRRLKK